MGISNASFFAQHLGGANTCTHATHNVFLKYGARRATQVIAAYLLNEARYINAGGTGGGARCVVTKVTTISRDQCCRPAQRRVQITEISSNFVAVQAIAADVGNVFFIAHRLIGVPLPARLVSPGSSARRRTAHRVDGQRSDPHLVRHQVGRRHKRHGPG